MTTADPLARRGDHPARLRSIMLFIVIAIATTADWPSPSQCRREAEISKRDGRILRVIHGQ
jgi:hypothetical protein